MGGKGGDNAVAKGKARRARGGERNATTMTTSNVEDHVDHDNGAARRWRRGGVVVAAAVVEEE